MLHSVSRARDNRLVFTMHQGYSRLPAADLESATGADGQMATRASNGFRLLFQHASFSQIQDDIANSITRGNVGTALSAADNAEFRGAAVAVFPLLGSWRSGAVPVFAW